MENTKKLNNREKADAYFMRLEGASLDQIVEKYGVTKEYVKRLLPKTPRVEMSASSCIYPNISKWMLENDFGYKKIADLAGVTSNTIRVSLGGKASMTKKTIDSILRITGLTYEEAFKEAEPCTPTTEE